MIVDLRLLLIKIYIYIFFKPLRFLFCPLEKKRWKYQWMEKHYKL